MNNIKEITIQIALMYDNGIEVTHSPIPLIVSINKKMIDAGFNVDSMNGYIMNLIDDLRSVVAIPFIKDESFIVNNILYNTYYNINSCDITTTVIYDNDKIDTKKTDITENTFLGKISSITGIVNNLMTSIL